MTSKKQEIRKDGTTVRKTCDNGGKLPVLTIVDAPVGTDKDCDYKTKVPQGLGNVTLARGK
ncbi:hypothetical protein [Pseudodesulfovibrio piezophilus]|nr:hypothetical protein [Pseudodesulfovibrio piezophilus]